MSGFSFRGGGTGTGITTSQSESIAAIGYGQIGIEIPLDVGSTTGSTSGVTRSIASLRFNNDDAAPAWRWTCVFPFDGFVSGSNIIVKVPYQLTGSGQTGDFMRWTLEHAFLGTGDTVPTTYETSQAVDFGVESIQLNTFQSFEFIISGSAADTTKTMLACRLTRNASHGNDTYGGDIPIHMAVMLYDGWGIRSDAVAPVA